MKVPGRVSDECAEECTERQDTPVVHHEEIQRGNLEEEELRPLAVLQGDHPGKHSVPVLLQGRQPSEPGWKLPSASA